MNLNLLEIEVRPIMRQSFKCLSYYYCFIMLMVKWVCHITAHVNGEEFYENRRDLLTPRMFSVWDFVVGIFDRKAILHRVLGTFIPQLSVSM